MKDGFYQLTPEQIEYLVEHWPANKAEIAEAAALSTDIVVGIYRDERLCFIGLAPKSLISDTAYIWMIVTKAGEQHPIIIARHAKSFIETALEKYSCIFGHCFTEQAMNWLKSLGAKFTSPAEFEIRRG